MIRTGAVVMLGVLTLATAACGAQSGEDTAVSAPAAAAPTGDGSGGAAGTCLEGASDCVDTPQLNSGEPVTIDETGIQQLRRDAKFYLGKGRGELNETIRIARVDDEQFALTEDYRIGRITVELDTVQGKPTVTSATVELPDGPETFKLKK